MSTSPGRPTVDQVALLLRARTKDDLGNEVGTFDDETRPTFDQVEEQIDAAMALTAMRLPPLDRLPANLMPGLASVVAYRAAMRVEKSYFPEQVRSDRSAYEQLAAEYLLDLNALVERANDAAGGSVGADDQIAMIPVRSWTSNGEGAC